MVDELQCLPETGALPLGERNRHGRPLVDDRFAAPHHPADVDVIPDSSHWLLVWNAMESLDDLWSRGTKPEHKAPIADVVQTGSSLSHARRCAGVHIQNSRPDCDRGRFRREIAHLRHRVEAVRLRDPDEVQASRLKINDPLNVCVEVTGVADHHRELHGINLARYARHDRGGLDLPFSPRRHRARRLIRRRRVQRAGGRGRNAGVRCT